MQSPVFFYVDMQGKGKSPLPCTPIPKTNNNSKTKSNNKTKTKKQNQGRLHRRLDTPSPSNPVVYYTAAGPPLHGE